MLSAAKHLVPGLRYGILRSLRSLRMTYPGPYLGMLNRQRPWRGAVGRVGNSPYLWPQKQAPPLDGHRGAWWLPEADRDVIIPTSPATACASGGVRGPPVLVPPTALALQLCPNYTNNSSICQVSLLGFGPGFLSEAAYSSADRLSTIQNRPNFFPLIRPLIRR